MENIDKKVDMMSEKVKEEDSFMSVMTPYQDLQEYLLDVISSFQFMERPTNSARIKECWERLTKRLQDTKIVIPVEQKIKKYKFSSAERFCLFKILYSEIFSSRYGGHIIGKDLFQLLYRSKICSVEEAAKISFQKTNKIYSSGCVCKGNGELFVRTDIIDSFLGVDSNSKKKIQIKLPNISYLYSKLNQYVIGQEQAKKQLVTAVYEHFLRCKLANKEEKYLDKNNVLLVGPTGTGKTYLCRTLANILDIPFYIADVSQMTDTGFVGSSIDSVLEGLRKKIPNMGTKFPPSIIYLDEIDKICFKRDGNDVSGKGVQEECLKMLESNIFVTSSTKWSYPQQYDISNILFIAGGAFDGIDKIVASRNQSSRIGFRDNSVKEELANKQIVAQDLVKYGFMPEFIGRFSSFCYLDSLNQADLVNIMAKSRGNALEQYKKLFKEADVVLSVSQESLQKIADRALATHTGARGLKTILSNVLSQALFDCKMQNRKRYLLNL